jgi:Flp pilus assembly protein TadB
MVKRRGASKRISKKTVKKPSKETAKSKRSMYKTRDSLKSKKQRIFINFVRFFAFFVICLVLYFVTNNYVLWVLFGIGAIIGGAISFALLLVMVGFLLMKKKR